MAQCTVLNVANIANKAKAADTAATLLIAIRMFDTILVIAVSDNWYAQHTYWNTGSRQCTSAFD
jgi:hypothetical protein